MELAVSMAGVALRYSTGAPLRQSFLLQIKIFGCPKALAGL